MTFKEILPDFLDGCKIRKKGWKEYKFIQLDSKLGFIIDENREKFSLEGYNFLTNEWKFYAEKKYFNFNIAFSLMKKGKKVARKAFPDYYYLYLSNGLIYDSYEWCRGLHEQDLDAKDWYLVED